MTDPVQAFRAISWLILKWLLVAVAGVIAVTALGVGVYLGWHWFSHDRHVAQIKPEIRIDGTLCAKGDSPLFVGFLNNSSRPIDRVTFTVSAKVPGRSSNIADYHSLGTDSIIKPGQGLGFCYRVPKLSEFVAEISKLEWSLLNVSYTFGQ